MRRRCRARRDGSDVVMKGHEHEVHVDDACQARLSSRFRGWILANGIPARDSCPNTTLRVTESNSLAIGHQSAVPPRSREGAVDLWSRAREPMDNSWTANSRRPRVAHRLAGWARPHRVHSPTAIPSLEGTKCRGPQRGQLRRDLVQDTDGPGMVSVCAWLRANGRPVPEAGPSSRA